MTHYHQLWDVPAGKGLAAGIPEIDKAAAVLTTAREQGFIAALESYYTDAAHVPAAERAMRYSNAMAEVAHDYPKDEAAIFYALSLIATAPAADRTHQRQKQAA